MSVSGGPDIITNGLILNLDAANIKSFNGEPTTNVVTNTNLNTGWSQGYCTSIIWNNIDPPFGIDSPVVSFYDSDTSKSGYWYSYGDYAPQVPSTIYTVSLYVKTNDSNFRISFYTADNAETGRYWSEYITVSNDNNWHRIIWNSFTNPSNSQSDSLSFHFYFGNVQGESQRTWLCAPQMEAKSYATPFVNGTRGTTVATGGGFKDLSPNNIDGQMIVSPVYDSSNLGSLFFNGTDSKIETSSYTFGTNGITMEVFYKAIEGTRNIYARMLAWKDTVISLGSYGTNRSEERRVGKECPM
jgi:hypothetical protein